MAQELSESFLLDLRPLPVFDRTHRVVTLWSAKAASVFAIRWAFGNMGLLEPALAYSSWIHDFRMDFYNHSRHQRLAVRALVGKPASWRAVKFVRHPLERTVSGYCRFISEDKQRCSFREFVAHLETSDLMKTDVHYMPQAGAVDSLLNPTVICLDERFRDSLKAFEQGANLALTPEEEMISRSPHHAEIIDAEQCVADQVFDWAHCGVVKRPAWNHFYDLSLKERVQKLYSGDFAWFPEP